MTLPLSGGPSPIIPPPPGGGQTPTNYFTESKKGEVNELLNLLRQVSIERDTKRKRDVVKKVIAYMTLGIDVSRLFSDMVKCVDTKDLILKKMVYLYLTSYANKHSELAIMCINTLLMDCRNEDPMVRGLALRSLCSLRLDSILEYIHDPLQKSLTDSSAYVRKTGVVGILKVFHLKSEIIKETDMVDTLYNMLKDRDPQVVTNCITALNDIMSEEGGMAVNKPIVHHLLSRLHEFNEWGQCIVLDVVSSYNSKNSDETFYIMNILEQCLRVSNSAVILACIKCFLHLTDTPDMAQIQPQVLERIKQPMLTLLAGGSHELNHCVLHHISLLTKRYPNVFNPEYRQFYARYNEPSCVKYIKVDILSDVTDVHNVGDIIAELSEYVTDVDQELARKTIRAIAKIGIKLSEVSAQIVDSLLDFLEMDMDYVQAETMIVMKDLLRKYPEQRHEVLSLLPKIMRNMEQVEGKCAIIWILGEYGQDCKHAPYVLESLIDRVGEETSESVCMELLSSSMKLFFKRPPEMQSMLGRLLQAIILESNNQDVHDRALFYYRLLQANVSIAQNIMCCKRPPISIFAEMISSDVQNRLFYEFNSLSVVFGKPSELFVAKYRNIVDENEEEYDQDEDEHYEHGHADQYIHPPPSSSSTHTTSHIMSQPPPVISRGNVDLLDMDFGGGPLLSSSSSMNNSSGGMKNDILPRNGMESSSLNVLASSLSTPSVSPPKFILQPQTSLDPGTFQQKWGALQVAQSLQITIRRIPMLTEFEAQLKVSSIFTMASGDVGNIYKFFLYGQDVDGIYYLAETTVDKTNGLVQASIKSDDPSKASSFSNYLQKALQYF